MTKRTTIKLICFCGSVLFAATSSAEGVLRNKCFFVTEDGVLKRLTNAIGCFEPAKFDQKSAEGINGGFSNYVPSNTPGNFDVFEANYGEGVRQLDMYSKVTVTAIKNGKVTDQTTCNRDLEKSAIPWVKKDNLTCVTINQKFCDNFSRKVKELGVDTSFKDLSKCANLISTQMDTMLLTISDSWKDKGYHDLAANRFDESKKYTDKFVSKKLAGLASFSYNLSDSDPASGAAQISGIREGYNLMKTFLDTCTDHFIDSSSTAPSKKTDAVR
jgi:hypothetical protein